MIYGVASQSSSPTDESQDLVLPILSTARVWIVSSKIIIDIFFVRPRNQKITDSVSRFFQIGAFFTAQCFEFSEGRIQVFWRRSKRRFKLPRRVAHLLECLRNVYIVGIAVPAKSKITHINGGFFFHFSLFYIFKLSSAGRFGIQNTYRIIHISPAELQC